MNWFCSVAKTSRLASRSRHRLKARLRFELLEDRLVPAPIPAGTILVPDSLSGASEMGAIIGVDPDTGAQTVITSGNYLQAPQSVREAADGTLLIVDNTVFGSGALIRYDPNHTTGDGQSIVSVGQFFQAPAALELVNGQSVVADPGGQANYGTLLLINPNGSPTNNQTILVQGGSLAGPSALTPGPGNSVYVGDVTAFGGSVIQVDLTTRAQTVITQGDNLNIPADVAVDATDNVIVTDTGDTSMSETGAGIVVSVDTGTGDQTLVASGNYLNNSPNGHVLTPDGRLFVATLGFADLGIPSRILSIDLGTGAQTVVSEGGSLGFPGALAVYQAFGAPAPGGDAGLVAVARAAVSASSVSATSTSRFVDSVAIPLPVLMAQTAVPADTLAVRTHEAGGQALSIRAVDSVMATPDSGSAVEVFLGLTTV